jgi:hypothetical protein
MQQSDNNIMLLNDKSNNDVEYHQTSKFEVMIMEAMEMLVTRNSVGDHAGKVVSLCFDGAAVGRLHGDITLPTGVKTLIEIVAYNHGNYINSVSIISVFVLSR